MYEKWINKQVLKLIDQIRYKNNKDQQVINKEDINAIEQSD